MHAHAQTHAFTHSRTHARTHTHTHKRTRARVRAHTYMRARERRGSKRERETETETENDRKCSRNWYRERGSKSVGHLFNRKSLGFHGRYKKTTFSSHHGYALGFLCWCFFNRHPKHDSEHSTNHRCAIQKPQNIYFNFLFKKNNTARCTGPCKWGTFYPTPHRLWLVPYRQAH